MFNQEKHFLWFRIKVKLISPNYRHLLFQCRYFADSFDSLGKNEDLFNINMTSEYKQIIRICMKLKKITIFY